MIIEFDDKVLKTQSRLKSARIYLGTLEGSLSQARKLGLQQLRQEAKLHEWPPEEWDMESDNLNHEFDQEIPTLVGNAFIAYLQSIVEYGLLVTCERLHETKSLPSTVNELVGGRVDRSKLYLSKVAGISVGADRSWASLKDLAKLRNIVVHAGSEVERSGSLQTDIQRMQKHYPDKVTVEEVGWADRQEVRISLALCDHFLTEVEGFFERLFKTAGLQGVTVRERDM